MNSLTTSPSQHAFKASNQLLSASRPSKFVTDPNFRTNNLDIFPSLSPFSNFYKNKKQNEASGSCRRCPDILEPVKKYKLNNGDCKVAPQENVSSHSTTPIPILPKIMTDKDSFRVPRLPKRLCEENQTSPSSKATPISNFEHRGFGLVDHQASFAIKDSFIQDQKVKEENLEGLSTIAQLGDDDVSNKETMKKSDQGAIKKELSSYPVMDTSSLTEIYEKLRLEYLLLQYNEQVNGCGINLQDIQSEKQKSDVTFDDLVDLSKDLFREHVKKTEVNC